MPTLEDFKNTKAAKIVNFAFENNRSISVLSYTAEKTNSQINKSIIRFAALWHNFYVSANNDLRNYMITTFYLKIFSKHIANYQYNYHTWL